MVEIMMDDITFSDSPQALSDVEPARNIVITNKEGKQLTLEFKDKLKVSGNLDIDEAAEIFIDSLKKMWGEKW